MLRTVPLTSSKEDSLLEPREVEDAEEEQVLRAAWPGVELHRAKLRLRAVRLMEHLRHLPQLEEEAVAEPEAGVEEEQQQKLPPLKEGLIPLLKNLRMTSKKSRAIQV